MAVPNYNNALSPIKNLHAFLRHLGVVNVEPTPQTAIVQFAHFIIKHSSVVPKVVPSALATAGAGTITAAMLDNGIITRDTAGAADRVDTTDTAANIIAQSIIRRDYSERFCLIHNISATANKSTLAAGTGVTIKGTITIEQNCAVKIAIVRTSSTTVAIRQV